MSVEASSSQYDPTTPEDLLVLAKHLATNPKLDAVFRHVGLHKPFRREPEEYGWVVESRQAFAPYLRDRLCGVSNAFLAEALARRLHAGTITSDADALDFLSDRIQHVETQRECSRLLESEIKDIAKNLIDSPFFQRFEERRRHKEETISKNIDPYDGIVGFVSEQISTYGLGGRGWSQVQGIITSLLNRLWFGVVTDLSASTVEYLLKAPGERLFLHDFELPRKG